MTDTDKLTTIEKIRMALDELQEIHGIEYLTYEVIRSSNKPWVRCQVNMLERNGEAQVIHSNGGRGRKTIIRKNRNSPGSPRRSDKHNRQIP